MPFFRAGPRLIYYAHVPKCGGSAIEEYLHARFGPIGLYDNDYTKQPSTHRWSRTSPQHIDAASLERMIPPGLFDAVFTIVRHPVARLVSAYHFQVEVERTIPDGTSFTDWLGGLDAAYGAEPFLYDNHMRPMADLVPLGADVFHLEHGLDALVPWFDTLTGTQAEPRAIGHVNKRGEYTGGATARVTPSDADLDLIATRYKADFDRFGYTIDAKMPAAEPPVLTPEILAQRDAALARRNSTFGKLQRKVRRKLGV